MIIQLSSVLDLDGVFTGYITLVFIAFILGFTGLLLLGFGTFESDYTQGIIALIMIIVAVALGIFGLKGQSELGRQVRNETILTKYEECEKNEYIFYFNGEVVNPEDYKTGTYNIAFDDYRHEVYIEERKD